MRSTFLPFSPPLIGEDEIAEVVDTLRSDWITTGFCAEERGGRGAGERPDLCSPARRGIIKLATDPPREEIGDFKIWVISTRRAEK